MISKVLQILGLQPRISKVFSRSLEQFFLTVGQNNFGNKIPFLFQNAATDEKSCLEEEQRAAARDRKERCYEHIPKYFEHDDNTGGMDLFFSSKFLVNTSCIS